jgi:hypothetical protein
MQLPTTSYPHGYNNNRHGGSTGVKSHFLLPILGWAVKTYHCTRHTMHYSATNHPRGRIRRVPYPVIPGTQPYPSTVDPPRPILDPASTHRRSKQECKASWHRTRSLFTVSSSTSPWCPGIAGHSRGTSLKQPPQRSTKLHLKGTPSVPASSYPIKGQAGGSTKGGERRTMKNQSPSHHRRSTSQAISFVLSLFSLWDLGSVLSLTACNPYAST